MKEAAFRWPWRRSGDNIHGSGLSTETPLTAALAEHPAYASAIGRHVGRNSLSFVSDIQSAIGR